MATTFYEVATTLKYLSVKWLMEKKIISCLAFITISKQFQVKNVN